MLACYCSYCIAVDFYNGFIFSFQPVNELPNVFKGKKELSQNWVLLLTVVHRHSFEIY